MLSHAELHLPFTSCRYVTCLWYRMYGVFAPEKIAWGCMAGEVGVLIYVMQGLTLRCCRFAVCGHFDAAMTFFDCWVTSASARSFFRPRLSK